MPDDVLFSLMLLCQIRIRGLPQDGNEAAESISSVTLTPEAL